MVNLDEKINAYQDKTRQVLKKLKEIKTIQNEMLTVLSQSTPEEIDNIEQSVLTIEYQIDDVLSNLWILKTNL